MINGFWSTSMKPVTTILRFQFFFKLLEWAAATDGVDPGDPLLHPDLMRMDQRALADLPLTPASIKPVLDLEPIRVKWKQFCWLRRGHMRGEWRAP